jgi:DNA-binding MarR family transcriptional regulator
MTAISRPVPDTVDLQYRREQAEAFLGFARILRQVERRVAALLAEHDLADVTPAQANVLMVLFQERRPLTAKQLADLMAISQPTVGRFIHALHRGGWVDRQPDPADSRAVLVKPTRRAFAALPRFIRVSNTVLDQAFAGFSPQRVHRIARTTRQIQDNLEPDPER